MDIRLTNSHRKNYIVQKSKEGVAGRTYNREEWRIILRKARAHKVLSCSDDDDDDDDDDAVIYRIRERITFKNAIKCHY
jgi:hypothetical protein